MIYVRPLDEKERQELKRLARREVGRVSERIRIILLSSKGYSVSQIADIFECDQASVRSWIERFQREGVQGLHGLHDRPRGGRPCKADVVAQRAYTPNDPTLSLHAWLPLRVLDHRDAVRSSPQMDGRAVEWGNDETGAGGVGLCLAQTPPHPSHRSVCQGEDVVAV